MTVSYLHLPPGCKRPPIGLAGPFKAVLVLEQAIADDWQNRVSEWSGWLGGICVLRRTSPTLP